MFENVVQLTLVNRKIGYGIVQPGASLNDGVPVIKVNNIISGLNSIDDLDKTSFEIDRKYSRTKLKGGELVISLVGSVGKTAIIPKSFAGCNLVRATGLIDIEDPSLALWVKYYIDSPEGQRYINSNLNTTVQITLNIKSLVEMPIPLPSREVISKIVSILKSLDDKIENNRKINENLEQQAQALFKSWFVDFEPFRDQPFVESELGMIPEGWRVRRLEEFCDVFTGKKNVDKSIARGKYPFFSCSPINTYSNEYIYDGESIIIAGNGSYTGRTSFYIGKYDLYQRTYACVLRPGVSKELSAFLYFMMKNLFEPFKMGGTRGSSIPYIVMKDITLQSFPYFEDIANKFSNISYFILRHILANQAESHRLSLLRDTLLPKLMSGEIKL